MLTCKLCDELSRHNQTRRLFLGTRQFQTAAIQHEPIRPQKHLGISIEIPFVIIHQPKHRRAFTSCSDSSADEQLLSCGSGFPWRMLVQASLNLAIYMSGDIPDHNSFPGDCRRGLSTLCGRDIEFASHIKFSRDGHSRRLR